LIAIGTSQQALGAHDGQWALVKAARQAQGPAITSANEYKYNIYNPRIVVRASGL